MADREYPRYQFRAPQTAPHIEARVSSSVNGNQAAARDLGRYYAILRHSLPAYTEPEASLIVDALNGSLMDESSAHLVWAEVEDAIRLDGLDAKWSVDGADLVARLRAQTYAQNMALVDAVERFWASPVEGRSDRLQTVGLVR